MKKYIQTHQLVSDTTDKSIADNNGALNRTILLHKKLHRKSAVYSIYQPVSVHNDNDKLNELHKKSSTRFFFSFPSVD